jgi:hypothetical protein
MTTPFIIGDLKEINLEKVFYDKKVPYHNTPHFEEKKSSLSFITEDPYLESSKVGKRYYYDEDTSLRSSLYTKSFIDFGTDITKSIRNYALNLVPPSLRRAFTYPYKEVDTEEKYDFYATYFEILLYKKGDFFVKHRDTKKSNYLATMLIFPPAINNFEHQGGKLKLYLPDGTVKEYDSSKNKENYQVLIFDQNLEHEIEPIISGNRVVIKNILSYNKKLLDLIIENSNEEEFIEYEEIKDLDGVKKTVDSDYVTQETNKIIKENFGNNQVILDKVKTLLECQEVKKDYLKILEKIPTSFVHNLAIVVLNNYYQNPSPKFFYQEDLELLKEIKREYPKVRILNQNFIVELGQQDEYYNSDEEESSDEFEREDNGYVRKTYDDLTIDEEKIELFEHSFKIPEELIKKAIWLSEYQKTGKLQEYFKEYNDQGYDIRQHRDATIILIEKD